MGSVVWVVGVVVVGWIGRGVLGVGVERCIGAVG